MPDRLQKIIARAGVASRRKAEELITGGRVTVDGEVVRELGSKADLETQTVCVDGKALKNDSRRRYLMMHKPKGCITTTSDPEGRPTVMDLLGRDSARGLFPVGRLDYNTEGLLLLTDDGDFANRILSAKQGIPKVYEVKLSGRPAETAINRLRDGIKLDGRLTKPESIRLLRDADNPWYEVTLVEGRNRQIHRSFERVGILVEKIRRVAIGGLPLRGLEPRQVRELQPKEIEQLFHGPPAQSPSKPRASASKTRARPRGRPSGPPSRPGRKPDSKRGRSASPRSGGPPRGGGGRFAKPTRSAKPRRPPGQRRSSAASSRPRAKSSGRGASPPRSRAPSRGPRSSRHGSKPMR